jgi:hypothetical protein
MVGKAEKYKIIHTVLNEQMDILMKIGYRLVKKNIEVIYPNIERYKIVFASQDREVLFSFTEKNVRNELLDSIRVMVSKDEYNFFELETYLKIIGISSPEEKLKLTSYEGDFQDQMIKFCEFVKEIFSNQLRKVISGDEWINVGMDWGSYK